MVDNAPPIEWIHLFGPIIPALVFIGVMSCLPEPARQRFNAIFVAGAGAVYLSYGGLGAWEYAFTLVATYVAYKGLDHYRYIGLAWLMHTGWDLMHHFYGNPIMAFDPMSSLGCAICDAVMALWFFRGAPSVWAWGRQRVNTGAEL